jgi:hypothetical protein
MSYFFYSILFFLLLNVLCDFARLCTKISRKAEENAKPKIRHYIFLTTYVSFFGKLNKIYFA